MMCRNIYCALVMVTYFILYGCVNLGPDYVQPDLGIQTPESYENAPDETGLTIDDDRWWEVFGDRELIQIVEEVIKNNWDIKQAAARVLEVWMLPDLGIADWWAEANPGTV